MSKAATLRTRKQRRQGKAVLRHGKAAKPKHQGKSGRTGSMFSKALQSRG